ncbi:MAG: UvrD-helicase domain-containing protein [Gammaproteobacteria bacterium]
MTDRRPADSAAREAALDPAGSYIVQAPAGSGKTELLTRRFLRLLAGVQRPEEILAITFTRKAAGEMRDRILDALAGAESDTPPGDDHSRRTWELARAALARDRACGWKLADNPRRLRVETIDALNAWLARQLPVSSGLGSGPNVAEDARPAYQAAARRVLSAAGTDHPAAGPAAALLGHLGNRFGQAEALLVDLLARRDHWLRRIGAGTGPPEAAERDALENAVAHFVDGELARVWARLPGTLRAELGEIGPAAARRAPDNETLAALAEADGFPAPESAALPAWRGIAELLLTKQPKWRKTVTASLGLGPDAPDERARMMAVLADLQDDEPLARDMDRVRKLPDPAYGDERWEILGQLLALLPLAAAELELEFAAQSEMDFVGVAQAALDAVGPADAPSDLALALDYRIAHILVDEFQDTSQSQVDLLERLTAGWTPGDGRTLFCVGDPMQSIYRFREADVGRFLKVRRDGIGQLPLVPLELTVNFRSQGDLVRWVGEAFGDLFPEEEDLQLGAVPFSRSEAWKAGTGFPVTCNPVPRGDRQAEAEAVTRRIAEIRSAEPESSVAVLVRSRRHLAQIGPALTAAGIGFQAVDVQTLARSPVVQDLLALTRALYHRADRVAWLAVVRAPWCGLDLAGLTRLAGEKDDDVWSRLRDPEVTARLGEDDRLRLRRLVGALAPAMGQVGRRPVRRVVNGAWLALGGGATTRSTTELEDARRFFEFLDDQDRAGNLDDPADLEARTAELFAAPDVEAGDRVQLMTVHKAKGLEFDHVILPGMDRGISGQGAGLLRWLEQVGPAGPELIFAPVEAFGDERDPLHQALKDLEARRDALEQDRLLYVAATRARRQLHLYAGVDEDDPESGEPPQPGRNSPLERLWPAVGTAFLSARGAAPEAPDPAKPSTPPARLRRLRPDWSPPAVPDAPAWEGRADPTPGPRVAVEYDWAGRHGRSVGLAVHRMLEVIALEGPDAWPPDRVTAAAARVRAILTESGVEPEAVEARVEESLAAVRETLEDPRGRWILAGDHRWARSEYRLSGRVGGEPVQGVVDRCFVDESGTLWIVDFKVGRHEGAGLEAFLDRERERYRAQLERYATLAGPGHEGAVRLGLYFPRHRGWREWEAGEAATESPAG